MRKLRSSLLRRKSPEKRLEAMSDLLASSKRSPSPELIEELVVQISERALAGELEAIRIILEIDAFEKAVETKRQRSSANTTRSMKQRSRQERPEHLPIIKLPIKDENGQTVHVSEEEYLEYRKRESAAEAEQASEKDHRSNATDQEAPANVNSPSPSGERAPNVASPRPPGNGWVND